MSRHETFSAAGPGRATAQAAVRAYALSARLRGVRLGRVRLWSELVVLFVGAPLLVFACFDDVLAWGVFGPFSLVTLLWFFAGIAAALLALTPGFRFGSLLRGPVLREWPLILACSAISGAACLVFVFALVPGRFLHLPMNYTGMWLFILAAYPVLSAWPQEIIYRSLFFERYGVLFPGTFAAVAANGAAFGFGHLLYMHPVTIAMTALGGALIGWAYLARGRSIMLSWVLHSVAGQIIFTSGIGIYFHSGGPAPVT